MRRLTRLRACSPRVGLAASLVALCATVALSLLATAATAAAAPARWIVFSATAPGVQGSQLFRIQTSGKGLAPLTRGTLPAFAPSFSPDGKRIAFSRQGAGIFVVGLDGKGLRRLTANGRDSYPAWSPDGKQLAFIRPLSKGWALFTMTSTGGDQRQLPKAPLAGRPTWNGAGLLLPSGGDLVRVDPRTGAILKYYGAEIDAIWGLPQTEIAPDTSMLTFVGSRASDQGDTDCGEGPCQRFALYLEDLAKGRSPRLIVRDAGPAAFSPDGRRIVFVAQSGLVIRTLAGGASTRIATGKAYPTVASPPAWQPR